MNDNIVLTSYTNYIQLKLSRFSRIRFHLAMEDGSMYRTSYRRLAASKMGSRAIAVMRRVKAALWPAAGLDRAFPGAPVAMKVVAVRGRHVGVRRHRHG